MNHRLPKHIISSFPTIKDLSLALQTITERLVGHRKDLHLERTAFGTAKIYTVLNEQGIPVRVLEQHGVYESATYLDKRYHVPVFAYQRAFDHVFEAKIPGSQILMIGGGGYAWPKHLLSTKPDFHLDVVEVDPAMTEIARKWFFLDRAIQEIPHAESRIELIYDDGRHFIEVASKQYSVIINDTFAGEEPVMALATIEAFQLAKRCLLPTGVYATNVVSEKEGMDISFLRSVVTSLAKVFAYVTIVPCDDEDFGLEDNYLVLASDFPWKFSNALPYDDDFFSEVLHDEPDDRATLI